MEVKKLVIAMEHEEELKGWIIYKEEEAKKAEPIPENIPEEFKQPNPDQTEEELTEQEQRFKGKVLREFVPHLLSQYAEDPKFEYETFDYCVDEYFT